MDELKPNRGMKRIWTRPIRICSNVGATSD
jgi:hypothetical protein